MGVTVARRRRELAVLATLGVTRAQIRRTLLVETSLFALCGLVIGVPLGVMVGRGVWSIVAGGAGVATDPSIPGIPVLFLLVGTVLFTSIVGLGAGVVATRLRPGAALRSE